MTDIMVKSSQVKSTYCLLTDNFKVRKAYFIFSVIAAILSICGGFVMFFRKGLPWYDFAIQRFICESLLRGTDIYSLRGSSELYAGFHASPWGALLQNVFYGGFLPLETAKVYFTVIHFFLLLLSSYVLYIKTKIFSGSYALFVSVLSVMSLDSLISFYCGNAGGMISACLLISWLICNEHPYISGILIGFSMVKPQVTLIICLGLILLRHYMPVFIAAAITIISWFIVSLILHKGMFIMFSDFLFSPNTNSAESFAGIFSFMPVNYITKLGMSMLSGIIFLCLIVRFLPDNMPDILRIYPAFMASTFWCYKHFNDAYVLIFPAALCVFIMNFQKSPIKFLGWFTGALYCLYGLILKFGLFAVSKLIFRYEFSRHSLRIIYDFGIIIVGIIICQELRKIYSEAE